MTLKEIAIAMMQKGIDIPTISEILDVDQDVLQQIRAGVEIVVRQDDVVEAMNRLAWEAYEEGLRILREGTPSMKMTMIRIMFTLMRGLMGSQSPKQMAELVKQFKDSIELHDDDDDSYDEDATDDVEEDAPLATT